MDKKVSVVIVNWNGEKYIKKCIDSLLKVNYDNFEVIVIDNGSTDDSIKIIKDSFSENVILIENENIGYAAGANNGIKNSTGDYVLIANPDIVFGADYISKLVDSLEENKENAAAIGKKMK